MMTARAARPMVRALWIIPALTCMGAGLAWSAPPPAKEANPAAPAAGQAPKAEGGEQSPGTPSAPAPDPEARAADCKRYVAALSGDPKEKALLNDVAVKELAREQVELLTCRAVKEDSEAPCKLLEGKDAQDAIKSCRAMRSIFHEIRTYPQGRAFMFNDIQFEGCRDFEPTASHCDRFRAAARAGDASKCDALGEFQSNCRALIKLDKSLCTAPKIEGLKGPDQDTDALRKDCERQVESMAIYAKGLKAVAESGSPLEQQVAKAALQEPDACDSFAAAAVKACIAKATPKPSPSGTEPAAPPQKTPPAATPEKKPPS